MNRRELLRILGGALAIPVLSGWPAERLDAVGRAVHRRVRDGDHALRVLDPHQRDAVAAIAEVTALRRARAKPEDHVFHQIKSLTVYGYYTSEIGAAETHFQIIPGSYDGCVTLQ